MNLRPGTVLLDARYYRERAGSIREILICEVNDEHVTIQVLSGMPIGRVQSVRYFQDAEDWTLQGHWSTDPSRPIPPIPFPPDGYEVARLKYPRTVLKLTGSARVEFALVPSLEPYNWTAKDDHFQRVPVAAISPSDMPARVRYLDLEYRDGGLRRLIYRRRGQQWLLVRTLITPAEVRDKVLLAPTR